MLFCDEERTKIRDIKGKELLIELGVRWQLLKKNKDKRLESYQKLADEDKERYKKEKADQPAVVDPVVAVEHVPVVEPKLVVEPEPVPVEEKPKKQTKKKETVKKTTKN